MSAPDLVRALRPIARWLDRHGVEYRIGGSLASSVHGVARSTLLVLGRDPYDLGAFSRHERTSLDASSDGETFAVLTPEDVVLRKLLWYRQGGEVSERQWNDVRGVLRVKGEGIDRRYLERWASELGIAELLDRALDESADS